jgi:DNA polymerase III epsilon subunit-like protein
MRALLFLDTETTGLDIELDRIVQLSTRLVLPHGFQDYNQLVHPGNFAIPAAATRIHGITAQVASLHGTSIIQVLEDLSSQIEQADIIVGHNVEYDIAIIIAEAKRSGYHDLVTTLTHPQFGLDGGRRAAICTQRLAAEYFRFLGESPSLSDTKLTTVYQRLFLEELVGAHDAMVDVIACQQVYNHLRGFQLEHELEFQADIICLDD